MSTNIRFCLGLLASVSLAGAADAQLFGRKTVSFRQFENLPNDAGEAAAKGFVEHALPPGTPMERAMASLEAADLTCRANRSWPDRVVCQIYDVSPAEGGLIGEDYFLVTLTSDGSGRLLSAVVVRRFIGPGPKNPG